MKSLLIPILLFTTLFAVFAQKGGKQNKGQVPQDNSQLIYRGEKINDEGTITTAELLEKMQGNESLETKVMGKVVSCCQEKGCWMQMDMGNGELMRVTFKDYGFFVPKESAGKTAIIQGVASYKTTSVAQLQHYAKDAGKSKEEIEAITAPEHKLGFVASGVMLK